jgi:hypothetical protein
MKKVIEELAARNKVFTRYAGSSRILYLGGENAAEFKAFVKEKYPSLAFELKVQTKEEFDAYLKAKETWEARPGYHYAHKAGNFEVFSGSTVDTEVAELAVASAEATLGNLVLTDFPFNNLPATKEQVDEYLLANPIDRNAKNPYSNAATQLNHKPDYIRGRWRSLRERGLVEKENA